MSVCPQCGGPHELSQCPRWRVPSALHAALYLSAWWLIPYLMVRDLAARAEAMLS